MPLPRGLLKSLIREGYSAPDAMREAWRRVRKNPGAKWHGKEATRAEGERYSAEGRGSFIGAHYYRGKRDAHRESQEASRRLGLNPSSAYDVFLRGKKIDTVFQTDPSSAQEVKRSLVEHDGYDPDIRVVKQRRKPRKNPGAAWYEVIVGNVGSVYAGSSEAVAEHTFRTYVERSRSSVGRAGGESVVLFRNGEIIEEHPGKENPGASWHEGQERMAEAMEKRETRPRQRTYLKGMADAHRLSAHESRKVGLNPPVAIRYLSTRQEFDVKDQAGNVKRLSWKVALNRLSHARLNKALTYPNTWVYFSGKNPRGAKTVVGRVFRAQRWAKRWAQGRPVRKVKGGWQVQAGAKRRQNPDVEMTFNTKAKAMRYASAMRKLGHAIEVVKGQYGTYKTIIHETRKNPIAVYNPPPGRLIYGRVLTVEAQKTNGSHKGKRFRHSFTGDSRVAAYALPDGSVLLKSAAGKRLWADR